MGFFDNIIDSTVKTAKQLVGATTDKLDTVTKSDGVSKEKESALLEDAADFFTSDVPDYFGFGGGQDAPAGVTSGTEEVNISDVDRDNVVDLNKKLIFGQSPAVVLAVGAVVAVVALKRFKVI